MLSCTVIYCRFASFLRGKNWSHPTGLCANDDDVRCRSQGISSICIVCLISEAASVRGSRYMKKENVLCTAISLVLKHKKNLSLNSSSRIHQKKHLRSSWCPRWYFTSYCHQSGYSLNFVRLQKAHNVLCVLINYLCWIRWKLSRTNTRLFM